MKSNNFYLYTFTCLTKIAVKHFCTMLAKGDLVDRGPIIVRIKVAILNSVILSRNLRMHSAIHACDNF